MMKGSTNTQASGLRDGKHAIKIIIQSIRYTCDNILSHAEYEYFCEIL